MLISWPPLCSLLIINNYKLEQDVWIEDLLDSGEAADLAAMAAARDDHVFISLWRKMLNDYITHCIKNREYIEAQKAKDKITEAQQEIRKRNFNDIELR